MASERSRPAFNTLLAKTRYLILDRDPNLNAFAERFVRPVETECLHHVTSFPSASNISATCSRSTWRIIIVSAIIKGSETSLSSSYRPT
jgi:hypothetical protein